MGGFFRRAHAVLVLELSNRLFPAFGREKDGPLGQNPLDIHSSFRNADLCGLVGRESRYYVSGFGSHVMG